MDAISKKYTKFSKNEKNELSNNRWVNVCFESNIINVPSDTWWLVSGATIHACNFIQAVISKRGLTSLDQYMYMGDDIRVKVDFVKVVRLQLSIENYLELQNVAYIPSIRRNLIPVPILERLGYSFLFGSRKVKLYKDSLLIGNKILCGSLYRLDFPTLPYVSTTLTVSIINSTKCLRLNEKSYILWHKRLGYISKQRMKRLIKDEILPDLDFSDFST